MKGLWHNGRQLIHLISPLNQTGCSGNSDSRPPSHFLLAPGVSSPSSFARRRHPQQTRPHCPGRKLLHDQLPQIQLHSSRKCALLNTLSRARESKRERETEDNWETLRENFLRVFNLLTCQYRSPNICQNLAPIILTSTFADQVAHVCP